MEPFTEGNGRLSRALMNAECVAAGERRIISARQGGRVRIGGNPRTRAGILAVAGKSLVLPFEPREHLGRLAINADPIQWNSSACRAFLRLSDIPVIQQHR